VILQAFGILFIHAVVHIPSIPGTGGLTEMRIATRAEIAHLQFHL